MKFQAADVEKITGVKRNRLQQWIESGFLKPSIQVASGHGTRNIWSRNDLYAIVMFKKITESGLSRRLVNAFISIDNFGSMDEGTVDKIALCAYMRKGDLVGGFALVLDNDREKRLLIDLHHIERTIEKEKKQKISPFDDVYIINFAVLKAEIDENIKKLS